MIPIGSETLGHKDLYNFQSFSVFVSLNKHSLWNPTTFKNSKIFIMPRAHATHGGKKISQLRWTLYVYDLYGNLNIYPSLSACGLALNIARKTISRHMERVSLGFIFSTTPLSKAFLLSLKDRRSKDQAII